MRSIRRGSIWTRRSKRGSSICAWVVAGEILAAHQAEISLKWRTAERESNGWGLANWISSMAPETREHFGECSDRFRRLLGRKEMGRLLWVAGTSADA